MFICNNANSPQRFLPHQNGGIPLCDYMQQFYISNAVVVVFLARALYGVRIARY